MKMPENLIDLKELTSLAPGDERTVTAVNKIESNPCPRSPDLYNLIREREIIELIVAINL